MSPKMSSKSIEIILTDSEIEAFILETNLIKKYKPRYNKLMVDDKNYSFIKFTNEDFQAQIGQPIYGCINITSISRL